MPQTTKETVTTRENGPTPVIVQTSTNAPNASGYQTIEYLIYFFFGVVEVLLALRLVLMFTGASLSSSFVNLIYNITQMFVLPFQGIFRDGVTQVSGSSTNLVFEPSSLVAIVVYMAVAFGLVALLRILSGKKQVSD